MSWRTNPFKLLLAIAVVVVLALPCGADEPSQEYKVKAAFVFNFAKFIEWPKEVFSSADAPFVIAVVGTDPFNGSLEQAVAGKRIGTRGGGDPALRFSRQNWTVPDSLRADNR